MKGQDKYVASPKNYKNYYTQPLDISQESVQNSKIKEEDQQILPNIMAVQLELNLEKYSNQIKDQVRYVLLELLGYPSSELAEQHQWANRLGYSDLKNKMSKKVSDNKQPQICKCCNLKIQQRQIPTCASFWEFPKVGISTFLFFEMIKIIAILIFILGVVFSIFALYTNIIEPTDILDETNFPKKLSQSAKISNLSTNTLLEIVLDIEGWLLVAIIIIWWVSLFFIKCFQIKYQRMFTQQNVTASDFSIMIEDIPIHYTRQKIQYQLNRYYQSLTYKHQRKSSDGQELKPFVITKFCRAIPFYLTQDDILDEQLKGLDDDIVQKRKMFATWIEEMKVNSRFTANRAIRHKQYQMFQKMKERRRRKITQMEKHARQVYRKEFKNAKTTVFLSFQFSQTADIINDLNPQILTSKIRYILSCCRNTTLFTMRDDKTRKQLNIKVSRAPQPEEIIWGNIGVSFGTLVFRKIVTFSIIILMLGVSFGILYGLAIAQLTYDYFYLSIAVALALTLFNYVIAAIIKLLVFYERDFNQTDYQINLARKIIFTQLLNSVLIPILVNIYIKENLTSQNGLVYDTFFLCLTHTFLPPLLKIIDVSYFSQRFLAWYKNRPYKKIELKQTQLNNSFEYKDFELGSQYVYFLHLYLFICFYVTLHPYLAGIGLFGFLYMYWADKYCLLNRSKRPCLNTTILSQCMFQVIALGPLVLSLGALTWDHLIISEYASLRFTAHLICLGISILYFITPFEFIFKTLCHSPEKQNLNYNQLRTQIPTEYNRLNPATAEQGIQDYIKYLEQKRKNEEQVINQNKSGAELKVNEVHVNKIIEELTKIPSIFGKNTDITKKMDKNDYNRKPQPEEVFIKVPPAKMNETQQSIIVKNQKLDFEDDIIAQSKAETQKRVVPNINSNGNSFFRKRQKRATSVSEKGMGGYTFDYTANKNQSP